MRFSLCFTAFLNKDLSERFPWQRREDFVVTFPDVPEAITQGETIEHCVSEASDTLEEVIVFTVHPETPQLLWDKASVVEELGLAPAARLSDGHNN